MLPGRPRRHTRSPRGTGLVTAGREPRTDHSHPGMNILIVRLSALGDVVHAIPAAAALRRAFPQARIDWLVEARHRAIVDLVTVVDHVSVVRQSSVGGWTRVLRELRAVRYDVA